MPATAILGKIFPNRFSIELENDEAINKLQINIKKGIDRPTLHNTNCNQEDFIKAFEELKKENLLA